MKPFEIFCTCPPGLESQLCAEALEKGFKGAETLPGGIRFAGLWPNVMRANLHLRGATRVLARVTSFRTFNLSQLEKQTRAVDWSTVLRPDVPLRVDVTTRSSKVYHAGAAKQRIEKAISESLGVPIDAEADIKLMVRIDSNLATFSVDTSGAPLHKRGTKQAVGKAPLRETMAALFLRAAGYTGNEPVLDPMCGSGTFPLEAAEIAAALPPGRARSFAFEQLASFMPEKWDALRHEPPQTALPDHRFYGSDRNAGAIANAKANAARAHLSEMCIFSHNPISDLQRPERATGLIIANPPYGTRIGDQRQLFALYDTMGRVFQQRFSGWRVAIITTDTKLAQATKLTFANISAPIPHGGLKVRLFQTEPLK